MFKTARPSSLRNGLDRDVYQVLRRLEDEARDTGTARPTATSVYESIKRSNSSLARLKRRPLEDAVERVLTVRREEAKADEINDDSDAILEAHLEKNGELTKRLPQSPLPQKRASSTGRQMPAGSSKADSSPRQANGEARPAKRRKLVKEAAAVDRRPPAGGVPLEELAGMDGVLKKLLGLVWEPLQRGRLSAALGQRTGGGVLLHGPSGCGKTALVNAMAAKIGVGYIPVSGPSLIGGTSGESEKNIRALFDEAVELAPCLLFFDELECIAGKRETASKQMEGRMIAELNHGMDRLERETRPGRYVVVVAASNAPDSIEPVVRRRFGAEISIGVPGERAREEILRAKTRAVRLAPDVDFAALAKLTPGFVGSDLQQVVKMAIDECLAASRERLLYAGTAPPPRQPLAAAAEWDLLKAAAAAQDAAGEQPGGADLVVTAEHMARAVGLVQPAVRREGFSTIPDTTWSHVGAMEHVRAELEMAIIGPIRNPALYGRVGIQPAAGILLWGPPGCGKTLVAKAVANESGANFISIKGPELLSKWVGESERSVRNVFSRAAASAPCILFFDEMDALVPRRDDALSDSSARVVNALLTELDGVGDRSGVYVIAATNRPDIIDPAIRRPGRLGTSIYVGLPTPLQRADILRTLYRNGIPSDAPPDLALLDRVARDARCEGFSGADLGNLLQAAGKSCLRRVLTAGVLTTATAADSRVPVGITGADWECALCEIKPSVKDMHRYEALAE